MTPDQHSPEPGKVCINLPAGFTIKCTEYLLDGKLVAAECSAESGPGLESYAGICRIEVDGSLVTAWFAE